jgi:hypothetical protein
VAGATLLGAAAFNPIRRRVQSRVDHKFNRSRFDAAQEVGAFVSRLTSATDTVWIVEEAVDVIRRTLQPSSVGVWLAAGRSRPGGDSVS